MERGQIKSTSTLVQRGAEHFGMPGRIEFILALVLFVFAIALSVLNVLYQPFNSDEMQHLHVIWEWTRGLLQYRDSFDNHMPLFHIVFAPIAGLIGERPTILYWMRLTLLPMYFVSAWCTYEIGTRLFSRRAGIWATLSLAFFGGYYSRGIEFGTDSLWTPIWLLCITVLIRGRISASRSLVAGLLLGLCFSVSMKSSLLLFSLLLSTPLALALIGPEKMGASWAYLAKSAVIFLGAGAAVPVTIMVFFTVKGLWREFRNGVFDFNFLANQIYRNFMLYKSHPALAAIIFFGGLFVAVQVSQRIIRTSRNSKMAFPRVLILLVSVVYFLALCVFWPPISRTYLPFYPLCFVMGTGALLPLPGFLAGQGRGVFNVFAFLPLPALVALVEFSLSAGTQPFWKDRNRNETDLLRGVLALTEPTDYVFDAKGETVFRRRCFRPVLERITMKAIKQGIILDDAPQRCVETHTCVAATIMSQRFSKTTLRFVERNYLSVANNLRVAGEALKPSTTNPNRSDFEVVIPASYKIISRDGNASGTLDGVRYDGARLLSAGHHTFVSTATSGELVLLWAQAVDRHFTPFEHHTLSER